MLSLDHDHHIHSTFSDGRASPLEMVRAAERAGLTELGFADHVRRGSDWLPMYTHALTRLRRLTSVRLHIGVEAKILDLDGRLDLPDDLGGVERIVVADHQLPSPAGLLRPVKNSLDAETIVRWMVTATRNAVLTCPRPVVIGHLFSILPKFGHPPPEDPRWVAPLIDAALRRNAVLEVDERWRCPSGSVVEAFLLAGVQVVASSDAHKPAAVGRYRYVAELAEDLCGRAA